MRTELIQILQEAYPEYPLKHIDTANKILCLFNDSTSEKLENKINIKPLDNSLNWLQWLETMQNYKLDEEEQTQAIREICTKINEIIKSLNTL